MTEKSHVSHAGIESSIKLAKENIFWPGMCQQIEEKVRDCDICAKFAASQQKLPMMSHEIPTYAWQIISMDVFFVKYKGKQEKMLIMVDHFSDFFECCKLADLTPQSVIVIMKEQFARYGVPEKVISDNGTHFVNREMREFASKYEFQHATSSPYHQQGNGKAESAVKIAKNIIIKADEKKEDMWWSLLHWRNTPNKIGSSPVQRMMCRKTRCGLPSIAKSFQPEIVQNVPYKIEINKEKSKDYYDRSAKERPELDIGQEVYVQIRPDTKKTWSKGVVENKISDRSFMVNVNNTPYRRDRINIKQAASTDYPIEDLSSTQTMELPSGLFPSLIEPEVQRPKRQAGMPKRFADYDCSRD